MLNLEKRYIWAAGILTLILIFAAGMKYADFRNSGSRNQEIELENTGNPDQKAEDTEQASIIQVYVTGAVGQPGVYKLPAEARVAEAVNLAKALPDANLQVINLAQKLEDGMAIVVPRTGEEPASMSGSGAMAGASLSGGSTGKVNINTASVQELDDKLPGIGPTLAQRIIDYRNLHGSFAKLEDLNEVSGIGDKKFAELKDLITVR